MRLIRVVLGVALGAATAAPAGAQLRANRPPPRTQNNPRLLVANPYPANSSDSAAAIAVGDGLRREIDDVAGKWFNTITREQMNDALLQYAYPPDAVLPSNVARTLASQLQARFLVVGTLARGEAGRYTLQVRAIGMNDKAGVTASFTQAPGQSLEDLGKRAASDLEDAFKALEDAKKCWDQQITKPQDARGAAQKALRTYPNHGLAEYCLGEIAQAQSAPADTVMSHYAAATEGDAQSLEAWSQLAILYQQAQDSANTIRVFQEMLRVSPTNQPLREQAFRLFLQYGRANAAREVAEQGLEIDPTNADLWDLKSNACLFLEDFPCAVDALEQVFAVDTARADSAFYNKIAVAAGQQPDTVRLLKWARIGATKYPDNVILAGHLVRAYSIAGPTDSAVAAVHRLMAMDSTDLRPALRTIQTLATEGRLRDAMPLGEYVERLGDADAKQNYAVILTQGALPMLQEEGQDLEGAAEIARKAVGLAPPGGRVAVFANYVLGLATALQIPKRDQPIMDGKSCELAQGSQVLLEEAAAALTAGQSARPDAVAQYMQLVDGYRPRVESQIKAFCK